MVLSVRLSLAAGASPAQSDDIVASTQAWEARRLQRLQAEDGWLSLVGLEWLKEGSNSAGSAPKSDVKFPAPAPAQVGTFLRKGHEVTFQPAAGTTVTVAGKPVTGGLVKSDASPDGPDVLQVGRLRFEVIDRGDRMGIRIKDPEARARKEFHGIPTFAPSERWRIVARWEPSNPPVQIPVPDVLGGVDLSPSPGTALFTVEGKEYRLTPVLEEGSPELFFIFADQTNRTDTYGAGRFLYAEPAKDGRVILDFNRAYNPPCAFSAYATCPLPPKQNRLALRVEAGEKRLPSH
jgi:uncharacterized protein (DUF1684 family)